MHQPAHRHLAWFAPCSARALAPAAMAAMALLTQPSMAQGTNVDWQPTAREVVLNTDSGRILTASEDGSARIWSSTGDGEPLVLEGHRGSLTSAVWSSDGARVSTMHPDTVTEPPQ